jgi:hypothetical protein
MKQKTNVPSPLGKRMTGIWSHVTGNGAARKSKPRVLLASLYENAATIYVHAGLLPPLAASLDARAVLYSFSPHSPETETAYKKLGVPCALGVGDSRKYRSEARRWATGFFAKNPGKQDVLDLCIDGFPLGMLVSDTYQRVHGAAEILPSDPNLLKRTIEGAEIFFAAREYLDTHDVAAVIPDHLVYNSSGILAQLAWQRGIPVLFFRFANPFLVYCIPPRREESPRMEVAYQHTFDRYPEIFSSLGSPELRREKAGAALAEHLQGRKKDLIFGANSAYAADSDSQSLLGPGEKPRVLVMLHDFCDAPHVYGRFLFPDYLDWIHHLLRKASETPFEWLVKPHPNLQDRSRLEIVRTNIAIVTELKKCHPAVTFLDPSVSNLQLIKEGVRALFTVHGTAGHEFSFFGIPVVNAGPNPHLRYPFNLHPSTISEYEALIANAGHLTVHADHREIEEFYYMYYFSLNDRFGADFEFFPTAVNGVPDLPVSLDIQALERWRRDHLGTIRERLDAYVDKVIRPQLNPSLHA